MKMQKHNIARNLADLRRRCRYTQEEVAERIGVSRQAVAKWESGESTPDLTSCCALADLFHVTLDNLVYYDGENTGLAIPTKGKHFFGSVPVGERGQIIIPKKAREVFRIQAGDQLLVLGDEDRGLALLHQRDLLQFAGAAGIFPAGGGGRK